VVVVTAAAARTLSHACRQTGKSRQPALVFDRMVLANLFCDKPQEMLVALPHFSTPTRHKQDTEELCCYQRGKR
jgi:hypothetical protein